ncbi:thiamine diphosphokinase [Erysipelothrix aquatica]|uniref:thiamine diphosphokinase n=1 Tax=Erysipelothrix aquatica TaxID=2683714 RepID=UPI001359B8A6|nr:thiamine diphosphokinase [Erysipelothrix aquatica]
MRTVTLVLGDFEGTVEGDVIGVDYGALVCLNKGIPVMLACGDFDSVSEEDFQRIKNYAETTIRLNPMKDDTDFLFAYKQAGDYDEIIVYGGLGRRRDHEYSNVVTAMLDSRITLYDGQNKIKRYDEGTHHIAKNDYYYLSVVIFEPITITLEGFKYPLDRRDVKFGDTYLTSNEILDDVGVVTLQGGPALIIQANQ